MVACSRISSSIDVLLNKYLAFVAKCSRSLLRIFFYCAHLCLFCSVHAQVLFHYDVIRAPLSQGGAQLLRHTQLVRLLRVC